MTDPTASAVTDNKTPLEPDRPDSDRVASERVNAERTDTEGAHMIARHDDPSTARTATPAGHPETHVEWVRPTDMAARAGARVLEKTADVNQDVHELVRQASGDGAARIRRALWHRELDLTPDVSTGPAAPARGRQGVSR